MEKILDKLGIYDLFVNFITGVTMLWTFGYLQTNLFKISWLQFADTEQLKIWVLLLLSYFIGIIFQETSNFIETSLYRLTYNVKKRKIRCKMLLLVVPSVDRILMTTEEINRYKQPMSFMLRKKLKRDLDDTEINKLKSEFGQDLDKSAAQYNELLYHKCRAKAIRTNHSRLTNDQSHASMARSLALYSLIVLVISALALIFNRGEINIGASVLVIITSIVSMLLFARRNKRFSEMRYVSVFRACLYGQSEIIRFQKRNQ